MPAGGARAPWCSGGCAAYLGHVDHVVHVPSAGTGRRRQSSLVIRLDRASRVDVWKARKKLTPWLLSRARRMLHSLPLKASPAATMRCTHSNTCMHHTLLIAQSLLNASRQTYRGTAPRGGGGGGGGQSAKSGKTALITSCHSALSSIQQQHAPGFRVAGCEEKML